MNRFLKELNYRTRRFKFVDILMLQVATFCLAMLMCKAVPPLRKVDYRRWLRIMMACLGRPLFLLTRR